jgi:hypothetical protein
LRVNFFGFPTPGDRARELVALVSLLPIEFDPVAADLNMMDQSTTTVVLPLIREGLM